MSAPPLPEAAVAVLACPVCGAALHADATGLRCTAGHGFDRARQGHVTLLPPGGSPHDGDSAAMVADRAGFLAAGHYAGITAALADAVLADGPPGTLLPVASNVTCPCRARSKEWPAGQASPDSAPSNGCPQTGQASSATAAGTSAGRVTAVRRPGRAARAGLGRSAGRRRQSR